MADMKKSARPSGHHQHQHPASAHLRAAADAMDKHHSDIMASLPPAEQQKIMQMMGGGGAPTGPGAPAGAQPAGGGGGPAQVLSPLGGGAV